MAKIKKHKVELALERFNELLEDIEEAKQNVYTPLDLCKEVLGKIDNISSKSMLVLFNIEFAFTAKYNYNVSDITVYCECSEREKFAKSFGFKTILLSIEDFLESKNMKKFDVVVGNPPYSNGKTNSDLYMKFTELVCNMATDNIAFITPARFLISRKPAAKKMKDILNNFGVLNFTFLPEDTFKGYSIPNGPCYFILGEGGNSLESFTTKPTGEIFNKIVAKAARFDFHRGNLSIKEKDSDKYSLDKTLTKPITHLIRTSQDGPKKYIYQIIIKIRLGSNLHVQYFQK